MICKNLGENEAFLHPQHKKSSNLIFMPWLSCIFSIFSELLNNSSPTKLTLSAL